MGLGPPQKGVNCNFSWPEFDRPYGVRKLSISDASICSFSRIAQKIRNYNFNFLRENLEKNRSTEHYGAALEGSTIFLCRTSLGSTAMESCPLTELKYAILSRAGRKTKKLPRSKLFLSIVFKHGLPEGSTFLFQYSSMTRAPLESCRLGEFECEISPGKDLTQKSYGFRYFRYKGRLSSPAWDHPKKVRVANFLRRNSTSHMALESYPSRTFKYAVSAGLAKR